MKPRPIVVVAALALLALAAVVVDRLVVTDREAVIARVESAFEAAKRGDGDALADALDDDATWDGAGKTTVVGRVKAIATVVPPSAWRLSIDEVIVNGDRASVRGRVSVAGPVLVGGGVRAEGVVGLVRRGGAWKIASVTEGERTEGPDAPRGPGRGRRTRARAVSGFAIVPTDDGGRARMGEGEEAGTGRLAKGGFWAGPVLFVAAMLWPLPTLHAEGKAVEATQAVHVVLGLAAWMATWWMTEALPLAATSLLPIVILPVFGVMPGKAVAPAYFDDTITLFLGGFCLALAMEKCGLHRRLAYVVVRAFGTRPRALVFGFFAASGLVSMWVSNTATALMLMPVAVNVVRAMLPEDRAGRGTGARNFAACCVLAVAYGASLGGVGTLVGTPPNMIFRRHVHGMDEHGGHLAEVTFWRWLTVGVPLVVVLIPTAWLVLTRFVLPVPKEIEGSDRGSLLARLRPAARATFAERSVLVVFVVTALLWITREPIDVGGSDLPLTGWARLFTHGTGDKAVAYVTDGTVAVLASVVLFVLPSRAEPNDRLLTWGYAARRLPWGALLLFGGGFCLAEAFKVPGGLNDYLKAVFAGLGGLPHWLVILAVAFGMTALSEIANNTAATIMMLPILQSLAEGIGTNPLPILLAGTLATSCGFALPIATMPNTIAYGTGEVSVGKMGRAGLVLDVVATLVMVAAVLWLVPLAF